MTFDIDAEMKKATQQMRDAEDALVQSGFPEEQWMLIKEFIFGAMVRNSCAVAKGFESLSPDDLKG